MHPLRCIGFTTLVVSNTFEVFTNPKVAQKCSTKVESHYVFTNPKVAQKCSTKVESHYVIGRKSVYNVEMHILAPMFEVV